MSQKVDLYDTALYCASKAREIFSSERTNGAHSEHIVRQVRSKRAAPFGQRPTARNVGTALQCAIRQGPGRRFESWEYLGRRKLAGNNDAVRSDAHVVPGTG